MNENISKDRWDDLVLRAQENIDLPMATFEVEVCVILYADNEIERLKRDIEAYRGALGYPVDGSHDGRLSTGVLPYCGLCDAKGGQVKALEEQLNRATRALERAGFEDLDGQEWKPPLNYKVFELRNKIDNLEDRLVSLAHAALDYQHKHDLHGDGSLKAGRAWDVLSRLANSVKDELGEA